MSTVTELNLRHTPIWQYLRGYHIRLKHSRGEAEHYLRTHVPNQLRFQVKATLKEMYRKQKEKKRHE